MTLRKSEAGSVDPPAEALDLETRTTTKDHQALRLWLRLLSCSVRIENQVRGDLRRQFDITLPRFNLMAQLDRHPEGLRMSELSRRLMVSDGNVTGIADQLEREGLVLRSLDRHDRRAITLRLTASGSQRFREMAVYHARWIIELLSGLSREEKQLMFELLGKLKSHLNAVTASELGRKAGAGKKK